MKTIYLYLLDTMADWEYGYLLQGLTLQNMLPERKYGLRTVARTKQPIQTTGGITLMPDLALDELREEETAALLLIGADTWLDAAQQEVLALASRLLERGVLVAAICGATLGLANTGLLDYRLHTSNAPFFLTELVTCYKGAAHYKGEAAVADGNLITASSAGSLLWARYILEQLGLYSAATVEAWYNYFATGNADYFEALMATFHGAKE